MSDDGQDLIEYGLLVGVITIGAIVAHHGDRSEVAGYFTNLNAALPYAVGSAGGQAC